MLIPTSPEDFLRSVDDAKAERRRQKGLERSDEGRLLDPWERYRALCDHHEALQDASEHNDRKTRFALLILGSINAVNLVIVTRGDVLGLPRTGDGFVGVYVACYALLSLCFFFYAIAALRPRTPWRHTGAAGSDGSNPGLRRVEAVVRQTHDEYCENWKQAQIGHLAGELASMTYLTALGNAEKLRALSRVYAGLYVLVGLTAALLVMLGWSALR
jgi:hypothetical protein